MARNAPVNTTAAAMTTATRNDADRIQRMCARHALAEAELLWSTRGLVSLIPGAEAMNTGFAAKAESDDLLFDDPAAGTAIAITAAPAIHADGSQCDLFTGSLPRRAGRPRTMPEGTQH